MELFLYALLSIGITLIIIIILTIIIYIIFTIYNTLKK